MKKTINKIIGLFSFGLLIFAVDCSYAETEQAKSFQNAWEFMEERTTDKGAEFKRTYGDEDVRSSNYVNCGPRRCNKTSRACLKKQISEENAEYVCAELKDVERYKKVGYVDATEGPISKDAAKITEEKNCYRAKTQGTASAKVYCAEVIGENVVISAGQEADGTTCDVVEVSWYNKRKCLFCPMIGVLYAVADKMTVMAQKAFAQSFAIVIAVGLMIWVAFKILPLVSDLSKQDIAKFISELLAQSFKFLIAFFALIFYDQIFEMLIRPLIQSGMNFGTSFVLVESLYERFGPEIHEAIVRAAALKDGSVLASFGNDIPSDYLRNADNKFFDLYTYATMENFAYNVNLQYSMLQAIGDGLLCTGTRMMFFLFDGGSFGLGLACVTYGFCFFVFGFLMSIAFVFYLLDVVVQIGIVGALLPFLIASWPFKLTKTYSAKGFELLLNSIFTFMMMGLVVCLGMELIKAAMEFNTSDKSGVESGFVSLIKALSNIDIAKLEKLVNIVSIGFILFLAANTMGLMLISKASEFASLFAGGAMPAIASNLVTRGASAAAGAVKKATAPIASGFKTEFEKATRGGREKIKGTMRKAFSMAIKPERLLMENLGKLRKSIVSSLPRSKKVSAFLGKMEEAKRERLKSRAGEE